MTTKEERICMVFLEKMHTQYPHVKRLGPAVGPVVWKIGQLSSGKWWIRYSRQMGFEYKDRYFKGRYSHEKGGRIEIVEVIGKQEGKVVTTINGLQAAMAIDLKNELDNSIRQN